MITCTSRRKVPLILHTSYGDQDEMPVEIFFREPDDFPELEFIGLSLCDGRVLDVGAGVGSHSLYLQEKGFEVDALELSQTACHIMQQRGVQHIICEDFYKFEGQKYDTLLLLMNGIGLAGDVDGFRKLLQHSKELLTENGQLIFDSSDISYLYKDYNIKKPAHYFGEIQYQYEYKGTRGNLFKMALFRPGFIDQNFARTGLGCPNFV
jgi:2-polyprenyl-3-methyl-5-hydroxy-6-metoxy-1,4-benzoquinol methylase